MTHLVEEQWESFRADCLTPMATPEQIEMCRKCFYAGAVGGHRVVMDAVGRHDGPIESIGRRVAKAVLDLQRELEEYAKTVL